MNSKIIREEKGHYRLNYAYAQPIFDGLKCGLTLEQAAATVKVKASTVNQWLVLGERCPEEDAAKSTEAPDRAYRQFMQGVHSAVVYCNFTAVGVLGLTRPPSVNTQLTETKRKSWRSWPDSNR